MRTLVNERALYRTCGLIGTDHVGPGGAFVFLRSGGVGAFAFLMKHPNPLWAPLHDVTADQT